LRQNCLNIVLVRVPSIETAAAQEKFARKGSRKFTKMGVTTRVSHYDTDLEEQLERALALATEAKNQALLPKIAVHCLEESDRETAENFKGRLAEQQQNMFVIINDISPVAVNVNDIKVDEIKVIAVANVILNDKRLRDDFNLSVDDEMLVTMRRDMLSFFSRCGFFGEQDQSLDFSGMSAEELDSFMKELYRGAMYLRITRVNWKELRVWNDAQNAILRSL